MASPSGEKRDALRSTAAGQVERWEQRLADKLDALWEQQESVVLVRLQGPKARRGTRHWVPAPAESKALNPRYIIDPARWVLQAAAVAAEVFGALTLEVLLRLLGGFRAKRPSWLTETFVWPVSVIVPSPPVPSLGGAPAPAAGGPRPAPAPAPPREDAPAPARERPPARRIRDGVLDQDVIAQAIRGRARNVAKGVAEAVTEVQAVIDRGEAEKKPLDDIVADVQDVYATRKKVWTQRIVATNVVGAVNETSLAAAIGAGVGKKQWLSAHDQRTRDSHRVADGQVVAVDDSFIVGTAALDFPGDPTGPAEEVINCRCTMLFPMPELGQTPYTPPPGFGAT